MMLWVWMFGILCLVVSGLVLLALSNGLIVPHTEQSAQEADEEM